MSGRRDQYGGSYGNFPSQEIAQFGRFGFGSMWNDPFGMDLIRPMGMGLMHQMQDPFNDILRFSDAHKGLHRGGQEGSYVCQTFVSTSTMGKDGRIKKETYFENSAGQNKGRQTISQKQQAYQNNEGAHRIAEERMLNDKGRKIVKDKRGQEIEETNHYFNMDGEQVEEFDRNWQGVNHSTKFIENSQRVMQGIGNGRQYRQHQQQPRAIRQQLRQERPYRQSQQGRKY